MPPKKPINTNVDSPLSGKVAETKQLAEKVLFTPTPSMKKIKARFWTRYQAGPMNDMSAISASEIAKITSSAGIKNWWGKDGFKEWFLNQDEQRERLSYLFDKSLDSLEQILDNPDAHPSAKMNAIKMLAEITGYLGKNKQPEKTSDESINQMSESQLLEYIKRKSIKLVEEKVIDTEAKKGE